MGLTNAITLEGNEAAAYVAHLCSDVIAIYPITPSSPMGEYCDAWSATGRRNLWGSVPEVIEMQSEAGAAGAVHGALQTGAMATTFTASQGLLLMIPNMYKIAGELTPAVFHVSARALAVHALSIFGDHSDVMAVRQTGWAMLASNSVQEVMDMALISHAATLEGRVPVLHFFDGFRTSHEVSKIEQVSRETVRTMIDDALVQAHRSRALSPDHPVIRGTSQNPDVYFQSREAVNPYHARMPAVVQAAMDRFAELTGRRYRLFDYVGAADAERVVVIIGSGADAAEEVVETLVARGDKVGLLKVRLYRPFAAEAFIDTLPTTTRRLAVLDRTKEPGADGEPLYKDVITALVNDQQSSDPRFERMPRVVGGRYGLASKEFNPGMIKGIFDELENETPKNDFTVGINDDVGHSNLAVDDGFGIDAVDGLSQALFYGLGSDGTVSANKNTIKIIGEETDLHAQAYFVYDSKKAGAATVSHLRFSPQPIRSSYLIGDGEANFVACHQPGFLERYDMLDKAADGAVFLLNSPTGPDAVWDTLTARMQQQVIDKKLRFYTIDAIAVAQETGMGARINTVMQTCFFAISGILPRDEAIAAIKHAVEKTYGAKGRTMVERNFAAIDTTLSRLHQVEVPDAVSSTLSKASPVADEAPDFVRKVTAELIAGRGDSLSVSQLPCDGTYPVGTARWDKRNLALEIPVWDAELCIFCGKCAFVCPHAAIRCKVFPEQAAAEAPVTFKHVPVKGKEFEPGMHITYQVFPEDCTGCTLCVDVCPAKSKSDSSHKALNMAPQAPLRQQENENLDFFYELPEFDRTQVRTGTMKSAMLFQPLFDASGACVGCGETPYVKLVSQLFGDRSLVANATGCSSIYGGNLPSTPWAANAEGRGVAWSNSLFEDNAEFGLGYRITLDKQREYAMELLGTLGDRIGTELVTELRGAVQADEADIHAQRERVAELKAKLAGIDAPEALDHRRRWLGLRHRLQRPRPHAGVGSQRQHPDPRHRGLLQHRRPGEQGDTDRRGGQVRHGRQGTGQEGRGADRDELRPRLRRPGGVRRQGHAHPQGVPRGRQLRRAVADHRLRAMHRARRAPVAEPAPAEPGGRQRPLEPAALRSASADREQEPAATRLEAAVGPVQGLPVHRDPLQHAVPHRLGEGSEAAAHLGEAQPRPLLPLPTAGRDQLPGKRCGRRGERRLTARRRRQWTSARPTWAWN
jgi:pyruvate-ferredoxin/flavodoxin oxidoreductase